MCGECNFPEEKKEDLKPLDPKLLGKIPQPSLMEIIFPKKKSFPKRGQRIIIPTRSITEPKND